MKRDMRPRRKKAAPEPYQARGFVFSSFLLMGFFIILARLFYWQVFRGSSLQASADQQYERLRISQGRRGTIYTADGFPLVTNQRVFRLFAEPQALEQPPAQITDLVIPYLLSDLRDYQNATESAEREDIANTFTNTIRQKLERSDLEWVSLKQRISEETKKGIESLEITGLGFEPYYVRAYPEASMAAHVTGFVGKDVDGYDIGYFGVEGALEKELAARSLEQTVQTDALGKLLNNNSQSGAREIDGRDVTLTIRRDVQHLIETELLWGLERYGAEAGEVVVMDPQTGEILGLAAYPNYAQETFFEFDTALHKNPSLSNLYEPGSTFKVLTVAAGIDAGVVEPDTECDICEGPREYGKYTIRTWNDEYFPNTTIVDGLARSDNTAMIFVAERLGAEVFAEYLRHFGFGEQLNIDLQEDVITPFPEKWGAVELATVSFGQGISTNTLQMTSAISSIANNGTLMRPTIISSVTDNTTGETLLSQPEIIRQVVSPQTAATVTDMMVAAAEHGEAQWISSDRYTVAGKTGTSQVAIKGGYDENKTIASFVGFSPASSPRFIMFVKFIGPTSSPWASETAAPLWYRISEKLYLLLEVSPDKNEV